MSTAHEGSNKPFWVGSTPCPRCREEFDSSAKPKRFELISPELVRTEHATTRGQSCSQRVVVGYRRATVRRFRTNA
ncbi:hypothetical protein BS297_13940, partial [Rhodococcus erythropolis]